jgi:hypothetical protein
MVITTAAKSSAVSSALNFFDSFTYGAVGFGSQVEATATALVNEQARNLLENVVKDLAAGTYIFTLKVAPSQAVGTITEFGIFDAATGGSLGVYNIDSGVVKSNTEQHIIYLYLEVTA